MTRPLLASQTKSMNNEDSGGREERAGPVLPHAAGPGAAELARLLDRMDRLERENRALTDVQAALRAQLADMRARGDQLLHMIEHIQARQELTPALPLPLARLGALILEPGPSIAFLREMVRLGVVTGTAVTRNEAGEWRAQVRPLKAARNVIRDFSGLVFGQRSVVYRVRQRDHALPERPRILHVIPNVFVGGSTQLVVDLMERLGHRYEMEVVTAALPRNGRHEGMELHVLPLGSPAEAFAEVYGRVRPDIIHMHYWGESDRPWYQSALAAAQDSPAALLENVNTPVEPLRDARIRAYLFVSQYIRDAFAPDVTNGQVIHPGIDLERFTDRGFAPGAEDTIGMVYRLTCDKLDENSVDPLIDVAQRRPRTRIIVVGNGDLLPVFYGRVKEAGVRSNFEFTGIVPFSELPELYRQFRIFVAPVVRESFGQVAPFAMAMGQAVAGFKVGALPEILGGTETLGTDRAELADILVSLLDAPERMARLGAANRERVRMFAMEGMIGAYEAAYAAALPPQALPVHHGP